MTATAYLKQTYGIEVELSPEVTVRDIEQAARRYRVSRNQEINQHHPMIKELKAK